MHPSRVTHLFTQGAQGAHPLACSVVLEWDRRYLTVLGVAGKRLYELRLQVGFRFVSAGGQQGERGWWCLVLKRARRARSCARWNCRWAALVGGGG